MGRKESNQTHKRISINRQQDGFLKHYASRKMQNANVDPFMQNVFPHPYKYLKPIVNLRVVG